MKFSWWIPFLALTPAAFVLYWLNTRGATAGTFTDALFIVSLLALIPLAQMNSALVERLARGAPKVLSGLLNACLDNVPEIAIGFWLLLQVVRHNNADLLKTNYSIIHGLLLGSVIENILFTLGMATLIGAFRHGKLRFSREKAAGFASMLGLAVVGLALPTLATSFATEEARTASTEIWVSVVVSAILMISYVAYVAVEVFGVGEKDSEPQAEETGPATVTHHVAHHAHEEGHSSAGEERELATESEEIAARAQQKQVEAEQSQPQRSFGALAGLLVLVMISVAAIAGVCATLVTVSDRVIAHTPITPLSFGLIILPVVCNFGELLEAGQLAFRKDMEAAMEVAAGSSIQVPLFVTPVLIFAGLIFAALTPSLPAALTLIFPGLALITLGLSAFVYALVNLDGETTWLEGAQLIVFYAMIAITAFALPGA